LASSQNRGCSNNNAIVVMGHLPLTSLPLLASPRPAQREKRRKAWLKSLKKWVQSMIRERVLYPNPLAIAAVRYQYRTSLGVFYFRLFLRVSALSGRAWSICWSFHFGFSSST
jgi:hypothetical protein